LLLAGPPVDALSAEILKAAQKEFGELMEYFGRLEPPEVDAFLDRLDVFLFPSAYEHEAEPLVLLEAARGGVPAIAFDVGCISDLAADHRWLIPATDSFSLAVVEILKEWDGQHRDQARARVQSTFLEHHARGTDAYDQLIPLLVGESTA
jgi:glycosyltransferase involved in cell wall biosynthesis